MKVPILIGFAYFFSLKTKANPSPKGNGFAFTLFGDPYGFLPLDKGKANDSLRGVCRPTLVDRTLVRQSCWIAKRKHTRLSVLFFLVTPTGIEGLLTP